MPRLFIAIEISRRVKAELEALHREIPGMCWVPPEQIHLTLAFLGEVEEEKLELLFRGLGRIEAEPFTFRLTGPGCFPRSGKPRVLWYGVERLLSLERLAQRIRNAVTACGIELEERPFSPHITLARVKGAAPDAVKSFVDHPGTTRFPAVTVRQFVLFQSILSRQGALHQPLKVFPCLSAPSG